MLTAWSVVSPWLGIQTGRLTANLGCVALGSWDVHTTSTHATVYIAIQELLPVLHSLPLVPLPLLLLHLQQFPQRADTTHMPLKKDCVLFTVTFIRITIQMIYRLSLQMGNSFRVWGGQLEAVCVCVCECDSIVCGSFGRGKVLECVCSLIFIFFSSSPWFSCSVTLSFLSHNLHGNKMKLPSTSTTHSQTNLNINEPRLL